ncbi:MAG: alpha-amylase family glycosyl hydrolase, partial [Planctomycetota bacterium]
MSQTAVATDRRQLGAELIDNAAQFGVWAPHADSVAVIGDFTGWDENPVELSPGAGGCWWGEAAGAQPGDGYLFVVRRGDESYRRIDPCAYEVSNSVGHAILRDRTFDWGEDTYQLPDHNKLVIYELHVGTFNRPSEDSPGCLDAVADKLDYLQSIGINAIQLMPLAEFAGDISWGYNPAHPYAVESAYGGPDALKRLVKAAHEHGIGVILDVVYNHFGPSDLDLWQFDGWSENGKGGIYFYNDWRSETPWGDTRPDYGREEVREYIHRNALTWLRDFHVDGLRYDMTLF